MRIIALGNNVAGDDGAALLAAKAIEASCKADIVFAGRPGAELLDLLEVDEAVILLDVVAGTGQPGKIVKLSFNDLLDNLCPGKQLSSHGFGPTETLQLGQALGRPLPEGCFIGIEGQNFAPGDALSAAVSEAMDSYVDCVRRAISEFS